MESFTTAALARSQRGQAARNKEEYPDSRTMLKGFLRKEKKSKFPLFYQATDFMLIVQTV